MRPLLRASLVLLVTAAVCRADAKWIEANGVRIVEPPSEHPRLYLRARDLPDVRRRMTHPVLKPVWDELQAAARENIQIRLELEALAYLLDHDAAPGRDTVALALKLLQKTRAPEVAKKEASSRPNGRMMVTGAIVYDWCYPLLSAEQKQAFIAELVRLAQGLECGYPPTLGSLVTGHPSEWMILRDMLSAGVAIYDEAPEMYGHAAATFFGKHLPARNWWYPGHAFHQGPGYADARFQSDMYPLWIFDRMGAGNVFSPAQQFVPYEWIYERRPDGYFVRSGDGQNWPSIIGSLLCASYYGDGYVLANALQVKPPVDPENGRFRFLLAEPGQQRSFGSHYKLFEFLWRDPDLKPRPLAELPLSRYFGFPYGWMIARTGWDGNSVIAQMKVNIYNLRGHQHADGGTFDLYYKGPLAIHSGVYQGVNGGYGGPHHRNYYTRTIAHNALLVYDPAEQFGSGGPRPRTNDGGQRNINGGREPRVLDDVLKGDFKTGTVLAQGFGPDPKRPDFTYLKGDIKEAYSAKVKEVKRSFVFLNLGLPQIPAALVVFDRVVSSNPEFRKYWLLHSIEEPVIEGARAVVALSENGWSGKLVNTTLLPAAENLHLSKLGGKGKEFWVFGTNYPDQTVPPDPEAGSWRVELSPRKPAATDLFLNVMQVMDRERSDPLAVEKIESEDVVGVRLSDRVVLFNPAGLRATEPVSFALRGEGTMKVLVTDLAEGTWQVWRDGQIAVPALTVSGDAGTAYFEGPAGSYVLRR